MRSALVSLAFTASAALAQPLPVLQFDPPQGFTGSLGRDPSAHVSMNADAMLNVYPFRRAGGPDQFRRTLLRDLLTPDSREIALAGPAEIREATIPGAEAALFAKFVENRYGAARYRLRIAIFSAGAVALVDYNAAGPDAYQRNWPAVARVLDSLKVSSEAGAKAEDKPGAATTVAVAGLYLGNTQRFMPAIGGAPGSGSWSLATRYYLLSPDGRFHRGYDLPAAPQGDIRRFDYAKAQREDAHNTGTYTVKGGKVLLRTHTGDSVEGSVAGGELAIDNMKFKKAALK